ncbi:hypothetical protein GGER_06380 [Serratia rubidaea]
MDLYLDDKVVIVTGGGSGIGAAISLTLAQEGAVPAIVTNAMPDEALLARLTALQPCSSVVMADLCRESDCQQAVAQVLERYGRLDGLVNNAGVNDGVGLEAGRAAFLGSLEKTCCTTTRWRTCVRRRCRTARGRSSTSPRRPRSAGRAAPAAIPPPRARCWR